MISIRLSQRRGVALVIVLAMLMLLSALLVAFMGKVGTERSSSRLVAQSFEARQAYDSAVNLVMSQIREATSNPDGKRAWASQPGAIRVFDDSKTDFMVYKLYSSNKMQLKASDYKPADAVENGFGASPAVTPDGFVDMNEPVLIPMAGATDSTLVEAHYPIVNPYAATKADGKRLSGAGTERFGTGVVEGFVAGSIDHPGGLKTRLGTTNSSTTGGDPVPVQLLPMRVRWIYQLKDGTMVAADPSNGKKIPGATKANPPVARIAFWTDDESSKININTAGENTYWDTPHASCIQESGNADSSGTITSPSNSLALAASQPSAREYQRFPGHPATTNLSPVLRWMAPTITNDRDFKEAIFRLSPRLVGGMGSSMGGTRATDFDTDLRVIDRDRLFATVDEYWFRPDRSPVGSPGVYRVFRNMSAAPNADTQFAQGVTSKVNITPEALERVRFFLTASSRAPELNLFGTPRVCIWPVHEQDSANPAGSKRSAYDDLIAFCSTVAGKSYYFTRSNPWSTTYDFETASGGRNKALVDNYLKTLTKRNTPGTGNSFASKYSTAIAGTYTAMDQILLAIYDYIRCTNMIDTGRRDGSSTAGYPLAYTPNYSPSNDYSGNTKPYQGSGQVIPTVRYGANGTPQIKGYGRFITLSEAGLLFTYDTTKIAGWDPDPPAGKVAGTDYIPIRCILLPEMYTPSPGYPALSEAYAYRVTEGKAFTIAPPAGVVGPSIPMEIGSTFLNYVEVDAWRVGYGRFFMPTRGFNNQFFYDGTAPGSGSPKPKTLKKVGITPADSYKHYPFFSKIMYLEKPAAGPLPQTFTLNEGSLTFEFYPLNITNPINPGVMPLASSTMIQRITVPFPKTEIPVPLAGSTPFSSRIATVPRSNPDYQLIDFGRDTLRTVEAGGSRARGDIRIVAGLGEVPNVGYFVPTGISTDYTSKTVRTPNNFRQSWGRPYTNALTTGRLGYVSGAGAEFRSDKPPKIPAGARTFAPGDPTATGDHDRGISKHSDGPFINKPDEGNARFAPNDNPAGGGHLPYYRGGNGYEEVGQTYFSPNRLIASAVMFGSLPTGIATGRPWETLLFSPAAANGHKGNEEPKDYYLLDLFHMPVVEPYAISEPLSTAGKINLNTRLAPFGYYKVKGRGYIERNTGLHAVLKRMYQMAIPSTAPTGAHAEEPLKAPTNNYRFEINVLNTIEQVINPFLDSNSYFRSAAQICEMDLLFSTDTTGALAPGLASRKAFWDRNALTGDNQRERAYAHIYPRLTTKSNVFTVHIRAQSLVKSPNGSAEDEFDDAVDRVTGEYRGSTTIERYIDPNDDKLQNYDATQNATDLDKFYRFRILNSKRFIPQ